MREAPSRLLAKTICAEGPPKRIATDLLGAVLLSWAQLCDEVFGLDANGVVKGAHHRAAVSQDDVGCRLSR